MEQGRKDDAEKPRWDLVPFPELTDTVRVLTFGAAKYSPDNWQKVPGARCRYISGPITGHKDLNRPAFVRAAHLLQSWGHDTVSPLDACPYHPDKSWLDYMLEAIPAMLKCEAVAVLPGWLRSRGARIEVLLALALGIKVVWLRRPV